MVMCHMMADSTDELLAMADKIGVQRKWIQKQGQWNEHFDVCLASREKAVANGAIQLTARELVSLKSPLLSKYRHGSSR